MHKRNLILVILFSLILLAVPISSILAADQAVSGAEKRPLAQLLTYAEFQKANPGKDLSAYLAYQETYLLDQFPGRDYLRRLTAAGRIWGLGQRDNNLYYKLEGHLSKLDPKLSVQVVKRAMELFNRTLSSYFEDSKNPVFALIPDKNYYLAEKGGYPHYDYQALADLAGDSLDPKVSFLPLFDRLSLEDYYRTDPHWDQKELTDLAAWLLDQLGSPSESLDYTEDFYAPYLGTFAGQAALPVTPDRLTWLNHPVLLDSAVYNPVTGETGGIYREDLLSGTDPYDFFLGGAQALLELRNPHGPRGRQLTVIRDSYGSSLIPLLLPSYERITVIDLRYITMERAAGLTELAGDSDLLFLFSTSVINSPGAFLN